MNADLVSTWGPGPWRLCVGSTPTAPKASVRSSRLFRPWVQAQVDCVFTRTYFPALQLPPPWPEQYRQRFLSHETVGFGVKLGSRLKSNSCLNNSNNETILSAFRAQQAKASKASCSVLGRQVTAWAPSPR